MSIWAFILLATAFGGALVLWHAVSRTKHSSEEMLVKYAELLASARGEKIKELERAAEEERQQQRRAESDARVRGGQAPDS